MSTTESNQYNDLVIYSENDPVLGSGSHAISVGQIRSAIIAEAGGSVSDTLASITTHYNASGQLDLMQELDSVGGIISSTNITWNAGGTIATITETDNLGVNRRITLNYNSNGDIDSTNPMTRTVIP